MSYDTPLPPWLTEEFFFPPLIREDMADSTSDYFIVKTRGFGVLPSCSPLLSPDLSLTKKAVDGSPIKCHTSPIPRYETRLRLDGPIAREVQGFMSSSNDPDNAYPTAPCNGVFVMGWGRSIASNGTSTGLMDSSFVACEPVVISRFFEVAIDHEGHVLSAELLDDTDENSYELDPASVANLTWRTNYFLQQLKGSWHSDVRTQDWMHYLLKILDDDNSALVDPSEDIPDPQILIPQIERLYKERFAALLYTAPQIFDEYEQGGPLVVGKRVTTETRLFMVRGAFIISTLVLAIDIIAAIFIYWRGTMVYLPRMPTTIASLLGYTAASRIASERLKSLRDGEEAVSSTFSFGHYTGFDGKAHLGIDVDPHVVPVDLQALKRGDTRLSDSTISKLRRCPRRRAHHEVWL
ncbi:hypothetical protein DL766_003922 [Monosporascus sp. MC13-8B]|uniref:Uncharacterized protein n=1 Tax=Monosporascus cannonballus TaxID=155416 RepID=A0ABY0HJV6_9PEZI|nr:hypothetical protein DL762_000988 [Monosporascus cannonballus]RYP32506.1 hypothetical protein DL766_003922 [Monosporascus sp. MC13-8B]